VRAAVARDFRRRGFDKQKVAAGVVRLIAEGYLRVGSDRYTRENHTYGTTTLHKRHAAVEGHRVVLTYVGKRGIPHRSVIVDPALAGFVRALKRAPGRRLFRFKAGDEWHDLTAGDVNAYLRDLLGVPYTAKDFRTWGGTLHAAMILADLGPASTPREAKKNVVTAIRLVAAELGNTPAVARKSYVHPIVLAMYQDHGLTIADYLRAKVRPTRIPGIPAAHDPWVPWSDEERGLIAFLNEHFPERRRRPREEVAA
jgi:DNA topoisomerase-1